MSWLSILIPVYNVRPFLEECLESILDQADANVEILALDDCSNDGSWELLQELAQRWPGRLRLLQHAQNAGLSAARNTMIEAATGEYLWFVDSDDKLLPGALSALANIVRQHSPDLILCDFSVWREAPKLKHRLRGEAHRHSFKGYADRLCSDRELLLNGLFTTGQMHAWSKISRRILWGASLRFPAGRYFEDSMCMPLLALRCHSFYYCPQPWVAYRQRATSILATMNIAKAQDLSASLRDFAMALRQTPLHASSTLQQLLAKQCSRNFVGAMRFLTKQASSLPPVRRKELVRQFQEDFRQTSSYSIAELLKIHLRQGEIFRALKLYYCVQKYQWQHV
ncbi:glycosyltransferase family 2 protein [Comamonas testosteroni]|uniref:Glycosyltransferase family 2 protein n=1 Tax=Comamonas testosteroni TaxID=285 RepID=A0A373FQ95_COMTE|nr:glycosyltransferase family 2 protein [Comamonas testosteroni]RGE46344.1 glycosyltransferase family 2 protein [Comamonas testosteroni]